VSRTPGRLPTIAVAAGKGGTGKTLVSVSLAQALAHDGKVGVQLLDCDVEEPNAHLLLRPEIDREEAIEVYAPQIDLEVCTRCGRCAEVCQTNSIVVIRQAVVTFLALCSGCGACAFACPVSAISEVPREVGMLYHGTTSEGIDFVSGEISIGQQKATPVTRAVKDEIRDDLVSVLDAPPGTACPMQETVAESDYCILVTEPTPFGLSDLRLAVETSRGLEVPCGVIVNRWGSGFDGVERFCQDAGIPVLLQIPQDRRIAEAYSRGGSLLSVGEDWGSLLVDVYRGITTPRELEGR